MVRFQTRVLVLMTLLACFATWPCRAQDPVPPTSPPPPPATQAPRADPAVPLPQPRQVPEMPLPRVNEGQGVIVKAPPLESTDVQLPINLAAALRLADARPLIVAAAQAGVWVAEAQLQRAQVLWIPTLNMGFDYTRHDGYGPDLNRGINTTERPLNNNVNMMYSGGGITQDVALTDAIFAPLAAKQVVNARGADVQQAKNDALLQTAEAYFNVHRARGTYAGALDCVERGNTLVNSITRLSKDLVPRVEVDRAKRLLADLDQDAASAREDWRMASADLTLVLRLDPRAVVVPLEHDHLQLTLIDPARSLDDLIPIGLTNRPELASQQALVQAALVRIRQEKLRPLLPSILLNGFQTPQELLEFGWMQIGNGGKMNLADFRDDLSPQVMWQVEGMGLGNLARIKEQRAEQSRAIVMLFRQQDMVAADVTRTQARLQSAAVRVLQADRSLREAIITFDGAFAGLAQTKRFQNVLIQIYRPQEVVVALENVRDSYVRYFTTVADYNKAQFQMFHALGYPASEMSHLKPPGAPSQVDTHRPAYMPGVGTGAPPATR